MQGLLTAQRRLASLWYLTPLILLAPSLTACSPTCQTTALTAVHPGRSLPLTAALREAARKQYLLSEQIQQSVVVRGSEKLKQVAISFDDGPHAGRTEKLLAVMTRLHIHGTFFPVGKMAVKSPYLIQEEILQGSEVGNHTYNHIHVTSLSDAQIAREIFQTSDLIEKYTGSPPVLFRPPGGRLSWGAYRAIRSCGVVTALWTDDPKDYLNPGKPDPAEQKLLMKRLMEHIRPGGIILLHDGILDTVAILPQFVAELRARGYTIGTITDLLLAEQRYNAAHGLIARDVPRMDRAIVRMAGRMVRPLPAPEQGQSLLPSDAPLQIPSRNPVHPLRRPGLRLSAGHAA